jgi:hypothetical protein
MNETHPEGRLQHVLSEDPRVAELGIRTVRTEDGAFVLLGEVHSAERRAQIVEVVAEAFPELTVHFDIAVTRVHEPEEVEEL